MGAPSGHPGHGKEGGIELQGQIQHVVDKTGIKVHIGGYALIHLPLPGDDLGAQPLHQGVQLILLRTALLPGQLLHKGVEQVGTGVGERVDRVTHTVNEASSVKCLLVQQGLEVMAHLVLVLPVLHLLFHVLKHSNDLDVGAAVLGPLQ